MNLLLGDQIGVLGMSSDVRPNERADGHDPEPPRAHVVERALHEHAAEAVALRVDLGMDELEGARDSPVPDLPRELVAVVQLVTELRRVVDDAECRV